MQMVIAYHFIFSAYGFWLPNDPRGSWSETIRVYELLKFGPATKVTTTQNLARAPHDRKLRERAKEALKHKPVRFTGVQARAIGRGFGVAAREANYRIRALAILPDHAHLVIDRHVRHIDLIAKHLKSRATRQLTDEALHPFAEDLRRDGTAPSPWSRSYWCPYIRDDRHLRAAIAYVEANPARCGLRPQRWRCVSTSVDPGITSLR
ncbi:MAG TPA: transposase [Tepidisphaeraceae bacterium]|nr:transposase [Tepidisphaeraceae bacterium]